MSKVIFIGDILLILLKAALTTGDAKMKVAVEAIIISITFLKNIV